MKFEKTEVFNFNGAFRGMRNPKNSWNKSDSLFYSLPAEMEDVTFDMLESFVNEEIELISIYYGADVDEETAEKLRERVAAAHPDCDVELQFGGQPVYYYIVSAE